MFKTVQSSILKEQIYLATGLCSLVVKIYEWNAFPPMPVVAPTGAWVLS